MESIEIRRRIEDDWYRSEVVVPKAVWRTVNLRQLERELYPSEFPTQETLGALGIEPETLRVLRDTIETRGDGTGAVSFACNQRPLQYIMDFAFLVTLSYACSPRLLYTDVDLEQFDDERWLAGARVFRCQFMEGDPGRKNS